MRTMGRWAAMLAVLGLCSMAPAVSSRADADVGVETADTPEVGPSEGEHPGPPEPQSRFSDPIERAWFAPAGSLEERVLRTRRVSLELGVRSLDGAARALLRNADLGDPMERSAAALVLAPDLPAAHVERARALWVHSASPFEAAGAIKGALAAILRHPEASLWFGGSALFVLAAALVAGGLLCITAAAAVASPRAAHDLGDLVPGSIPGFARGALLSGLLLLPLVLGHGIAGVAIALFGVGVVYGGFGQRLALVLAAAMVMIGAYPVAQLASATLDLFSMDPVAEAAMATTGGLALEQDRIRLEQAEANDLLAARALAMQSRREGDLAQADARYEALMQALPMDAGVANNAAGVRMRLGQVESAIVLYEDAAELSDSPIVFFNLAHAYGRAFRMEDIASTLGRAQQIDEEMVAQLTALQRTDPQNFVVDMPLPVSLLWRRVLAAEGRREMDTDLRRKIAPSILGRNASVAALAFGLVGICAGALGVRLQASRLCGRCGRRLCPRCDPGMKDNLLCDACVLLFHHPGNTDRTLRQARIDELRNRERRLDRLAVVSSILLPGVAGLLAESPTRSLLGAAFFAVAASSILWRGGVAPDPLVAGAAAPIVFIGTAVVASTAYAIVVAASLVARRNA